MAEVIAEIQIAATGRARDESGLFIGRLDQGTSDGADALAREIAAFAGGFAWDDSLPIVAHGEGVGRAVIEAHGRLAGLQFYGSPAHSIDSHDGGPLVNRAKDFYAPSGHVDHPGFEGDRFLETAGDSFEGTGLGIVASHLP